MAQPGSERRESPRVLVELRVEFRHLGRPTETYADIIRNLSQGGVFLDTSVGLPVNTEVELEVSPGPGARPIRLTAEVVRVEEEPVGTGSRVTTRTRGTGLGLPNAQRCIEAMGGSLTIVDSPLGGAGFCITLLEMG